MDITYNKLIQYIEKKNDINKDNTVNFPGYITQYNINKINPYHKVSYGTSFNPNPLAFYFFCKDFLGYDKPDHPKNKWDSMLQGWWCIQLQHQLMFKSTLREIYLKPRNTLKTSVYTEALLSWAIVLNPNIRILLGSATDSVAIQLLEGLKNILSGKTSDYWKYWIGDLSAGSHLWAATRILINKRTNYTLKEPTITAVGLGTNLVSAHYDYIHLDDPVNLEDFWKPPVRESRLRFFSSSLSFLEPSISLGVNGYVMIGTPWNEYDLYNTIEKSQNNKNNDLAFNNYFNISKEKAFYVNDKGQTIYRFPKILDEQELKLREFYANMEHPQIFWSQYQMETSLPEQKTFDIKIINESSFDPDLWEEYKTGRKVMAIDPSKGKASSDYTAIAIIQQYNKDNTVFYGINEIKLYRLPIEKLVDHIFTLLIKYQITSFYCEETGNLDTYGKLLKQLINQKYKEDLSKYLDLASITYLSIKTTKNKEMRLSSLSYPIKKKILRFKNIENRDNIYNNAIKQFQDFIPVAGANKYDDAIDVVKMAFDKVFVPAEVLTKEFFQ